jgi:hypothetical protein
VELLKLRVFAKSLTSKLIGKNAKFFRRVEPVVRLVPEGKGVENMLAVILSCRVKRVSDVGRLCLWRQLLVPLAIQVVKFRKM